MSEGTTSPDEDTWEHCLKIVCGRRKLSPYDGVPTERPYHRRFCLDIASWGDGADHSDDGVSERSVESNFARCTMATAHALFRGETKQAVRILKQSSARHPELLFVSLALQLASRGDADLAREDAKLDFDDALASRTDPYLRAISSYIATAGDWLAIANQSSLPLKDRVFVALRHLDDATLTRWLETQMSHCIATGDVEGIVLAGITERLVDVFAQYVASTGDFQTATLVLSICCPRYVDDYRAKAWRNAYRAYLQRHRAFFARTKFEVESTKRSKRDGRPTTEIPSRQISLRCIYCESELAAEATTLPGGGAISSSGGGPTSGTTGSGTASRYRRAHFSRAYEQPRNPLMTAGVNAGASCPMCGRHLPRCVVCLEVVGVPRTDSLGAGGGPRSRGGNVSTTDHGADARPTAAKFPTFCLRCEHVLHLDHARQWFARHVECPVPECRCRCNFRANPELAYH